jgi:hypothetical protein
MAVVFRNCVRPVTGRAEAVPTGTDRGARNPRCGRWGAKLSRSNSVASAACRSCANDTEGGYFHRDGVPRRPKSSSHHRWAFGARRAVRIAIELCHFLERLTPSKRRSRPAAGPSPRRSQPRNIRVLDGPGRRHHGQDQDSGFGIAKALSLAESHAQRLRQHRVSFARAAGIRSGEIDAHATSGRRLAVARDGRRRPAVSGRDTRRALHFATVGRAVPSRLQAIWQASHWQSRDQSQCRAIRRSRMSPGGRNTSATRGLADSDTG